MPTKKYYANNNGKISISVVDIVRESKNDVWISEKFIPTEHGIRVKKVAAYSGFFDTFKEAREFLYKRAHEDRIKAQNELDRTTEILDRITQMKEWS